MIQKVHDLIQEFSPNTTNTNRLRVTLQGPMRALDLHYLGSGNFSTVWAIGRSDVVLKISHKNYDYGRDYMLWLYENPGLSPHAPQIHSYVELDDNVYVTMPKYHEAVDPPDVEKYLYGAEPEPDNPLHEFLNLVGQRYPETAIDLHHENMMVDNMGVLIITDPVSYMEGY